VDLGSLPAAAWLRNSDCVALTNLRGSMVRRCDVRVHGVLSSRLFDAILNVGRRYEGVKPGVEVWKRQGGPS
jgi:hypothetical protein